MRRLKPMKYLYVEITNEDEYNKVLAKFLKLGKHQDNIDSFKYLQERNKRNGDDIIYFYENNRKDSSGIGTNTYIRNLMIDSETTNLVSAKEFLLGEDIETNMTKLVKKLDELELKFK